MTCCRSATEYVDRPVLPEFVLPAFPVLDGWVRNADGTVTVSEGWIVRLAEYRIRLEEAEANYNEWKALYEGGEKKDEEEDL